jgi:hypothetical protein
MKATRTLFLVGGLLASLLLSASSALCLRAERDDSDRLPERASFHSSSATSSTHALATARNQQNNNRLTNQKRFKLPSYDAGVASRTFDGFNPTECLRLIDGDAPPAYSSVCFVRFQGRAPPLSA